jgi:hypothetical protein
MKKLIFLFFLTTQWAIAQKTIDQLAADLGRDQASDSNKVVAIYDWITRNVSYDRYFQRLLTDDTTLTQEPYNVVRTKRAVCIGYAKLFRELCKINGIQAVTIEGWVKENNATRFVPDIQHAWNAVRLGETWYLVDATWDAGLGGKKYFFTPPSVFGRDHLPYDPMWQLQESPMTLECFEKGKNCTIPIEKFNFQDSIQHEVQLDSFSLVRKQAERMYRFNHNNLWAIRRVAETHSHLANRAIEQYQILRKQIVEKRKRIVNSKNEVLQWLDTAKLELETALTYYEHLASLRKKNVYTDGDFNADLVRENLENLANERAYIEKFFKN